MDFELIDLAHLYFPFHQLQHKFYTSERAVLSLLKRKRTCPLPEQTDALALMGLVPCSEYYYV
jgi:hypothetical protein